jgi:hypothetical protein
MRVIISGSRTIDDMIDLENAIAASGFTITTVIDGAHTAGVDVLSKRWATKNNIPREAVPALWKLFGRPAGPMRNRYMAQCKQAEAVIIVWDGVSTGSSSMKKEAEEVGLPIYLHIVSKPPVEAK